MRLGGDKKLSEKEIIPRSIKIMTYHDVKCPLCQQDSWDIEGDELMIPYPLDPTRKGVRVFLVICKMCSHTMIFSSKYLD